MKKLNFLAEKGHTDLVLDMVHSLLERKAKRSSEPIGLPEDWVTLLSSIRPEKPLNIINMVYTDFLNWKSSTNGKIYTDFYNNFKWKNGVRWGISRTHLCQSDSFQENVPCEDYVVETTQIQRLSRNYGPPPAYSERQKISISKLESLAQYVKNAKIPRKNLPFYINLPVDGFPLAIKELKDKLLSLDTETKLTKSNAKKSGK